MTKDELLKAIAALLKTGPAEEEEPPPHKAQPGRYKDFLKARGTTPDPETLFDILAVTDLWMSDCPPGYRLKRLKDGPISDALSFVHGL